MSIRVELIGKPGCHLCDNAREVVERVCRETGTAWQEIDVTTEPALLDAYAERIPVVLVDGLPWDFWRVDEDRLRRELAG